MADKQQSLSREKIGPGIKKDIRGASYYRKLRNCNIYVQDMLQRRRYQSQTCLATPASSVFSVTGNLVNKKRARLSPSTIDNMISRKKT